MAQWLKFLFRPKDLGSNPSIPVKELIYDPTVGRGWETGRPKGLAGKPFQLTWWSLG